MWEISPRVIKIGTCTLDPGRMASALQVDLKHQLGVGGGSTVTIIQEGDRCLLVDTGYERETDASFENLERNRLSLGWHLERNGIREADITDVFITHFHRDHCGGIERFEGARWCCGEETFNECPPEHKARFYALGDGQEVISGVRVIHTPGHTAGHSSLIWDDADGRVRIAVAGDAVLNLSWLRSGFVWTFNADFVGKEQAVQSAEMLADQCDMVIPGHGEPFFVTEEIRSHLRCG